MARPSDYTLEIADEICSRMVQGKGLLQICNDDQMPARGTVYRWLESTPTFRDKYARAREALMDFYAEQILVIAFDESGDIILDQEGEGAKAKTRAVANHAKVQRDRLKVDSLKWIASRLFPKRYGDKMELLGASDGGSDKLEIRWAIQREIVSPDSAPPKPAEPPRQIPYQPWKPPADLTPEAWSAIARVSELIEQIAPGDEKPEHVFAQIEGWLRAHYLTSAETSSA